MSQLQPSDESHRLVEQAAECRYVLLAGSPPGTDEARRRIELTKRLIAEHGFSAVALEADWPHADRVNRFVRGTTDDADAEEALRDFRALPDWRWRNPEVLQFVAWLRAWNDSLPSRGDKTGFYGLDLRSLDASIDAVVAYLETIDPDAAHAARERYSCVSGLGPVPSGDRRAIVEGLHDQRLVDQLVELRALADEGRRTGWLDEGEQFSAEQNARVVAGFDRYHRAMLSADGRPSELRAVHMADTLEKLSAQLDRTSGRTKVAIWTQTPGLTLGRLLRERYGEQAVVLELTAPLDEASRPGTRAAAR